VSAAITIEPYPTDTEDLESMVDLGIIATEEAIQRSTDKRTLAFQTALCRSH